MLAASGKGQLKNIKMECEKKPEKALTLGRPGFDIIMQIAHVVCQGPNIKMMLFLVKSARLNSEVSAPKSHLRAKM